MVNSMLRVVVLAACLALSHSESVTPVQKVIQMLTDMRAKGRAERDGEQKRFAQFSQWCENTKGEKTRAIAKSTEAVETLTADISKFSSDIDTLGGDIATLSANIEGWSADKTAAEKERKAEHEEFVKGYADFTESVDALERAIIVLKKKTADIKQAESFLEKVMSKRRLPFTARSKIMSLLQKGLVVKEEPDYLSREAPQANAYEFQSGGVIDLLEKLLTDFTQQRNDLQKSEMNSKHASDMTIQDLVGQVSNANAEKDRKVQAKASAEKSLAGAQGELSKAQQMKADDEKYLADSTAMCTTKSAEFEQRTQLRNDELEALEKAIEIMTTSVSGNAEKHSVTSGKSWKESLLQLTAESTSPSQAKALQFLLQEARRIGSNTLSALLEKTSAEDPFAKVKKMIYDMVQKLQDQANEEAEHKGWCDKEMSVNEQTRTAKQQSVDDLTAKSETLEAKIAKLGEEVSDLDRQVAELEAARNKATSERDEERAKNKQTVKDAKEAQVAVSQALVVLREFYQKAGTATALLQADPTDDSPVTWEAPYRGMQDLNTGVVGLLEVIESDFARLEAETTSNEETAQTEFENFMADSKRDIAVKNQMIKDKTNKKTELTTELSDTKASLAGTQEQLEAALRYYDRLKPSCEYQEVSFEERTKKRNEEIEALKTALKLLSNQQTE